MTNDNNNQNLDNEDLEDQTLDNQNDDVNDNDDSGSNKGDGKDNKGGKGEKTFTQEQVTRMMTREKNQGRNAAFKEMGIDPKDSKMVKMFKAFVESQKSDDQKAAEEESKNQEKIREANQRALVAEAKAEAMTLGIKAQYVDDVVSLALTKMTDDSDIKTVIEELKTKYPVWFTKSKDDSSDDDGKGKAGQKGTGSTVRVSGKDKNNNNDSKGLGARLAAQRKPGGKKSSYWG